MNQPTKDAMREQLAIAADEIIRLREDLAEQTRDHTIERHCADQHIKHLQSPWWRRWFA